MIRSELGEGSILENFGQGFSFEDLLVYAKNDRHEISIKKNNSIMFGLPKINAPFCSPVTMRCRRIFSPLFGQLKK